MTLETHLFWCCLAPAAVSLSRADIPERGDTRDCCDARKAPDTVYIHGGALLACHEPVLWSEQNLRGASVIMAELHKSYTQTRGGPEQ